MDDVNRAVIQNIKNRFVDLKDRQQDMHSLYMKQYANMQAREIQEVNLSRKFRNVPNPNNKAAKPKQFVSKQIGSTSNEQSNNNAVNTVNGSFTNGPSDMIQQKRKFDQFGEDGTAKIPRVADQTKFQGARSAGNSSFDVNSNQIQPNINPFQATIPKKKPILSLPVTSVNMTLPKNNSISTPQVVKNVEELLEGNMNMQAQNSNVKVKTEPSVTQSITCINNNTSTTSNGQTTAVAGFDDNMQYFGELIKNEVKSESDMSASGSDLKLLTSTSTVPVNSTIPPTVNSQQQQAKPVQQQLTKVSQPQTQQQQQQQGNSQDNQKWKNVLSTNISNASNQQPMNMMDQVAARNSTMNNTMQMTPDIMQSKRLAVNSNNSNAAQPLNRNSVNQLPQQQQQQQQPFQSTPNNMNQSSMNLSAGGINNSNNMNNIAAASNILNTNQGGNLMSVNVQQPPNLQRINSMASPRVQLAQHVITKNPPMVPNYTNVPTRETTEKIQEYLRRKMHGNPKYQQPMSNQMLSSMPNGMSQNNFAYSTDTGFNNQGGIQSQQNPMGYYPTPFQMENGNNPMFANNPPGYYPNKQQPNRVVPSMIARQPMNGMYNSMAMNRQQSMNQANIFSMNGKVPPPQYSNQGMTNAALLSNQRGMMNVNPGMQTPIRLTHYQPETNNMGISSALGMNNQMVGMRNPMNMGNQFPPALPRSIMQQNSESNMSANNQYANFINNQQQQHQQQQQEQSSFAGMPTQTTNMNFNSNNINGMIMQRRKLATLQQQQQQQRQQQQQLQQRQLLSQQQHQKAANFQNSNFNPLNTENNMHMLQHDNNTMANNMNFNNTQNFIQQNSLSNINNNTLQHQNSLMSQINSQQSLQRPQLHPQQMENSQQQTSIPQQPQQQQQQQQQQPISTLSQQPQPAPPPPPQQQQQHTLDNIGNLTNNQQNSPSNSLRENPLLLSSETSTHNTSGAEGDDFDSILDNPPEQFDLINELHSEGL